MLSKAVLGRAKRNVIDDVTDSDATQLSTLFLILVPWTYNMLLQQWQQRPHRYFHLLNKVKNILCTPDIPQKVYAKLSRPLGDRLPQYMVTCAPWVQIPTGIWIGSVVLAQFMVVTKQTQTHHATSVAIGHTCTHAVMHCDIPLIHPVYQHQQQQQLVACKSFSNFHIPSEVLIGKLLHPQEMFLPVLLRHNSSLLNERRYYKNRIKTSFQRQIHITSSTVPIIALPSADSPYVP